MFCISFFPKDNGLLPFRNYIVKTTVIKLKNMSMPEVLTNNKYDNKLNILQVPTLCMN